MALRQPQPGDDDLFPRPLLTLQGGALFERLPEREMSPEAAYQIVLDELELDGNERLLGGKVAPPWMEDQASRVVLEDFDRGSIDRDENPRTAELEMRCVTMLGRMWHSPETSTPTGCSTIGSGEAAMLGGLALKRSWQQRRRAEGGSAAKPNLVMSIDSLDGWERFATYWDVELRRVPVEGERFHLSAGEAVKLCDENTIGVVAVMGSPLDGSYEPVEEICKALDAFEKRTGIDVPVHVDGTSGAFVAPFLDPDLAWDFRLPRVASINASGQQYGLVYPGIGWIVWRDAEGLPSDLLFWAHYLGDDLPTSALNLSRPGPQVVTQYYNLIRLGAEGYRRVHGYEREVATRLAHEVDELGPFQLLTHGSELPVFAFKLQDGIEDITVFELSHSLRERGWQVPAFTFPEGRTDLAALRIEAQNGFTHELAHMLLDDLKIELARLEMRSEPAHDAPARSLQLPNPWRTDPLAS